jgi:hypothetical protein
MGEARKQPNELTTIKIAEALKSKGIKEVAYDFNLSYNSVWRISWLVKCGYIL